MIGRLARPLIAVLAAGALLALGVVYAGAATTGGARATAAQYGGALPPDLHVDVTASSATTPDVGSELDWFVTVSTKNAGGSSNARLELTLPSGWTYDHSYADRGPGCTGTPPKLTCNVAWINPSAKTHVTLFGKVAQLDVLQLVAKVTSLQEPELDPSDNTMTLSVSPPRATPTPNPGGSTGSQPAAPAVAGLATIGAVLRVGTIPGARYQWQFCTPRCRPIKGATTPKLKLVRAYAGGSVRVVVVAHGKTTTSKKIRVKPRVR